MEVGYPLRSTGRAINQLVSQGDLAEGTATRPIGPVEFIPTKISSTVRIPSQTIELSGWICNRPIRVFLDSGSTGNYISDREAHLFNLMIQSEEGSEQLTLVDVSEV